MSDQSSPSSPSPQFPTFSASSAPAVPQVSRVELREPTEEEKRLVARFADMESRQPDFLDEAGKSIIERITTFLAVLFAVTAFGSTFPPKYVVNNPWSKFLMLGVLACYLIALGMGMWAIQPHKIMHINEINW